MIAEPAKIMTTGFSAHLTMLERAFAKSGMSGPSVCLSVILVSQVYIVQDIGILFTPYDRAMFLVSHRQILQS